MKIRTESLNFVADTKLLSFIEDKVSKLEIIFNRISETHVILETEQKGSKKDRIAVVKVKLPNGIIYIKEKNKNFENAIAKAVIALKLELMRYKSKRLSYGLY